MKDRVMRESLRVLGWTILWFMAGPLQGVASDWVGSPVAVHQQEDEISSLPVGLYSQVELAPAIVSAPAWEIHSLRPMSTGEGSAFRLASALERLPQGGWRVRWQTQPGQVYRLQRWNSPDLGVVGDPAWVDVEEIVATANESFADDLTASAAPRRFYRVVEGEGLGPGVGVLRILDRPQRQLSGAWRVTWNSDAGSRYSLQYWTSGDLTVVGTPAWTEVVTVTAPGPMTFADDFAPAGLRQRYYRVVRLSGVVAPAADTTPPVLSPLTAAFENVNGQDVARLSVTAFDDVGVTEVRFLESGVVLAPASTMNGFEWTLTVPFQLDPNNPPAFVARARDAAGNIAFSPVYRPRLPQPQRFVAIVNGQPVEGTLVEPGPDGTFPPFEYRPEGGDGLGKSAGLAVRLTTGARVVEIAGREYLEFEEATLQFGSESPLQFMGPDGALQLSRAQTGSGLSLHNVEPLLLPLGPLSAQDVAAAAGYDPNEGLPILLFGKLPVLWMDGVLEDYGIRAPRFSLVGLSLPLPSLSALYPEFRLDFLRAREVRLPFHGEFDMPNQGGTGPRVRIPPTRPVWVTLRADGTVSLEGRVQLQFANGLTLTADLLLDDPYYQLQIASGSGRIESLGRLVDLLPSGAANCVPATDDPAQLDAAEACLERFAQALLNFSATVRGIDSGLDLPMPPAPPDPQSLIASLTEAWSFSALASTAGQSLPLDEIQDLLHQTADLGANALNLETVLRSLVSLERANLANARGDLTGAVGTLALDTALGRLRQAAIDHLSMDEILSGLPGLIETTRLLADIRGIRVELQDPPDAWLTQHMPALLAGVGLRLAESLGVEPGVFDPASNPIIQEMSRAAAAEALRAWAAWQTNLQRLGIDDSIAAPLNETLSQLALRLFTQAELALEAAETLDDPAGFMAALEDLYELASLQGDGTLPDRPELSSLPSAGDVLAYAGRLDELLLAELDAPFIERSLLRHRGELARLLGLLEKMPAGTTLSLEPLLRRYQEVQEEAATALVMLNQIQSATDLQELLEAGTLARQLAIRAGLTVPDNWTTSRLPDIITRLLDVAEQRQGWSELHEAYVFLMDSARRFAALEDPERRRLYLSQAARVLAAGRRTALALWHEKVGAGLAADGPDLRLPAEIEVRNASGAVRYNRFSQSLDGSFRGEVRLPQFGGELAIQRARLSNAGAFDLALSGQIQFPTLNPVGTATVPASNPLQLRYSPAGGLELSGQARFAFQNGLFFNGSISLIDPIYRFELEAGGLSLDLMNALADLTPALPGLDQFMKNGEVDPETLAAWVGLYAGITESIGGLGLGDGTSEDSTLAALEAWGRLLTIAQRSGNFDAYVPTLRQGVELLETIARSSVESIRNFRIEGFEPETELDPAITALHDRIRNIQPLNIDTTGNAFQIAFGASDAFIFQEGPAHHFRRNTPLALVNPQSLWWNPVFRTRSTGLRFADDSPADNIMVETARALSMATEVNWTLEPTHINTINPENAGPGVYASDVMLRYVSGRNINEPEYPTLFGTRVTGLGTGYFHVYALIGRHVQDWGEYRIYTGTGEGRINEMPYRNLLIPSSGALPSQWTESVNYAVGQVFVENPNDPIVVVASGIRGPNQWLAGQLNGVQIVRPKVHIHRFDAPTEIEYGRSALLSWEVDHAQVLTLTGTDGTIYQHPLEGLQSRATIEVTPLRNTTYTLSASNANGPDESRELRVIVRGKEAARENIYEAARRLEFALRGAGQALKAAEDCVLSGNEDCQIDLAQTQRDLDEVSQSIRDEILEDPGAVEDVTIARRNTRLVLDLLSSGGFLSLTNALGNQDVIEFVERTNDAFEQRAGFQPESVDDQGNTIPAAIDSDRVAAHTLAESSEVLRELIHLWGDMAIMGSNQEPNPLLLRAHQTNALEKLFVAVRYNPDTGAVQIENRTETELLDYATAIARIEAARLVIQSNDIQVPSAVKHALGNRLIALSSEVPPAHGSWQRLSSIARALFALAPSHFDDEIRSLTLRAADQMVREAPPFSRIKSEEIVLLEFMVVLLPDTNLRPSLEARIRGALEALRSLANPATLWRKIDMEQSADMLRELATLSELVTKANVPLTDVLRPETIAPQLVAQVANEARRRNALRELNEFNKVLLDVHQQLNVDSLLPSTSPSPLSGERAGVRGNPPPEFTPYNADLSRANALGNALLNAAYVGLEAAAELVDERLAQFRGASLANLIGDLQLPGSVQVKRVAGTLFYNRLTGLVGGSLAGELAFPDINARFVVTEASLSSDGRFQLQAATAAPLPFGNIRIEASLTANSAPDEPLAIAGSGRLLIPGDTGDQSIDVTVSYDPYAQQLTFKAAADGEDLRVLDDFVLFSPALAFVVGGPIPAGELRTVASIGLFAVQKPLPAELTRDAFHLFIDNTTNSLAFDGSGFSLALESGTLHLPDLFQRTLCPDRPETSTATGPAVVLDPTRPLLIRYNTSPEELLFTGALHFQDVGFALPGLDTFEVAACDATLVFEQGALPRFDQVQGALRLELPDQVLQLNVTDGQWSLDGFPTGDIQLAEDLLLFDDAGFSLVLLGAEQPDCPATGLRIESLANGLARVEIEGGADLAIPTSILTAGSGDAVGLRGCGNLIFEPGQFPAFTVSTLRFNGDFRLAAAGDVVVKAAAIEARNLQDLFGDNSAGPFHLIIEGGELLFPNGVAFRINAGYVARDGSFSIDAEALSGNALEFAGVRVEASIHAARTPGGIFSVDGEGSLLFTDSDRQFDVAIAYDQAEGSMAFQALGQNLDLRLTDDFVVFDAGFGFEVSQSQLAGAVQVQGSVGLFANIDPLPAILTRDHFHLLVDEVTSTLLFSPEGFAIELNNGTVRLPEIFKLAVCGTAPAGGPRGPSISLDPANPLIIAYQHSPQNLQVTGVIEFRDLGLQVPGIEGLELAVCSASLVFPENRLPQLSQLHAALQIPIPGQLAVVEILDGEWALDGFPSGTIALRDDLVLFDEGGFEFTLLGTQSELCPAGSALTIGQLDNGAPFFRLDGAVQMALPADMISDEAGGQLAASVCGNFLGIAGQFPQLVLTDVAFSADRLRLGGSGGLLVRDASLELSGLDRIFNQSAQNPFTLTLNGGVEIPNGPGFALEDARFRFIGEPLPRFTLGGFVLSRDPTFQVIPGMPIDVTEAGISFLDPERPLPELLAPDNLRILLSAGIALPPGPDPVLIGRVDGLTVELEDGVPQVRVQGIGMGIDNFEIPPLEMAGQVYIGGLDDIENVFFAGRLGGKLNGAGVIVLAAFNLRGPLGVCIDVGAGPVGIPLGPTGFLLTGVEGGVSFLNTAGDPCDFTRFYPVGDDGRPAENTANAIQRAMSLTAPREQMTWEQLAESNRRYRLYQQTAETLAQLPPDLRLAAMSSPLALTGGEGQGEGSISLASFGGEGGGEGVPYLTPMNEAGEIPCPTGDCPPPTVNILCQPHPDADLYPNNVIFKFSSLDESFMNQVGLTREFVENLGLTSATEIGANVAAVLRDAIDALFPKADPALLGDALAADLNAEIENQLNQLEGLFAQAIAQAVQLALGDNADVYEAILAAAYAGVPCQDATVKLAGTFSHASVSSFLSGTGGVILSTAGSAGVVGNINLVGIPVGQLKGFVSGTDRRGDPNPSICGDIRFAIGPIELGQMRALYECEGCVTGVLEAFAGLAGCLADEIIQAVVRRVAPEKAHLSGANALNALTDEEKLGFIAELFNLPPVPGLPECFFQLVAASFDSFQPFLTLCGDVTPKLFGMPMGSSLVAVQTAATRNSLAGQFSFSPSYMIGYMIGLSVFPPADQASVGFAVGFPDPAELVLGGLSGRFSSPDAIGAYLADGFDYMLQNATYTVAYEFSPFGLKGLDAQARIVMPNLLGHPAQPNSGWLPPEQRNLPTRLDVMLQALEQGYLANPLWKGTADDLFIVYPEGHPDRDRLQGLSFSEDYFPHGGMLGAANLSLPAALVDAPPESLGTLLDEDADPLARLGAALDFIQNHLLQTSEVGSLAFYLPAPNPPFFTDAQGQPLTAESLLAAIQTFDASAIALQGLYPVEVAFLQGYMDGRLLGVPIATAEVLGVPANPQTGEDALFRISAGIPSGSWLQSFIDDADLTFQMRQAPTRTIEEHFTEVADQIQALIDQNPSQQAILNFLNGLEASLTQDLPKVSLDVSVNNLRIPAPLDQMLVAADTSARLVAYSPRFEPSFPGTGPIATVRRQGGLALQGRLRFGDFITIDNAELALFPSQNISVLPVLVGRFDVPLATLPAGIVFHDLLVDFQSEPAVGQPFLAASGALDPIQIQPLLEIVPLNATQTRLGGGFRMIRGQGGVPQTTLSVDPARIAMPIFGPDLQVLVHGATTDLPFTFSTEEPWTATLRLEGGLVLRDLSELQLVRVGSPQQTFVAELSGNGLQSATLALDIPTGLEVTAFPGQSYAQTFNIGAVGNNTARLVVSSDGSFELHGRLDGSLNLAGLSVGQINAGADILLTDQLLSFTGTVSGGTLDDVNTGSATATVTITKQGLITLAAQASVPPLQFDRFRVSGLDGGNLSASIDNDRLRIESGARLAILGVTDELLTLEAFEINANGDFNAQIASGQFVVPNYFILGEGSAALSRANGIVSFEMLAPRMTVFPGAEFEGQLPSVLERVLVESSGRFYYDSGQQLVGLPGTFTASGRLELGYEPDANAPQLSVVTAPIQFGEVKIGQSTTRTLRLTNTGGSQLIANAGAATSPVFTVTPNHIALAPGQFADLTLRFSPAQDGTANGSLTLLHNTVTSPTLISLSGQGRAVPIYHQSEDAIGFGERPVGGGALRQLLLNNLGQAPLNITSINISGPFTTGTSPVTIPPGGSHRLFVTFRPEALGNVNGQIQIQANDEIGSHSVQLTGTGAQLRWYTQRDSGPTLRSIAMRNTSTGIAVGDSGTLLTTVNAAPGGIGWTPRLVAGNIALHDVAFYRGFPLRAWAVGDSGLALTTTDANLVQWLPITHPTVAFGGNQWRGISPWQPDRAMLVGQKGDNQSVIARQIDDQNFEEILPGSTAMLNAVSCLFQLGDTILTSGVMAIAVGNNGTIWRTGNNGVDWNPIALPAGVPININLHDVVLHPSGVALIVGDGGTFLRSTDFGQNFTRIQSPAIGFSHLYRVQIEGSQAWIVGQQGLVLRSDNAGVAWQSEGTTAGNNNLLGVDVIDGQVWTAGNGGHIQHRPMDPPAGPLLTFSTAFVDFGTVPVGATKRQTITLHNRGTDRLDISDITTAGNVSVGQTSLSIEPGASRLLPVTVHPLEAPAFDPPPGQPTGVLQFQSNDPAGDKLITTRVRTRSSAWVQKPGQQDLNLRDVKFPTALVGYAIHPQGLIKTTDAGESWTSINSLHAPGPIRALHFSSANVGWVGGGDSGSPFILRTQDGGVTWSAATLPTTVRGSVTGISFPPGNSTIGYAITDRFESGQTSQNGVVLRTGTGGGSWVETSSQPTIGFISGSAIHAYSTTALYVASGGALFRTTTSGASWIHLFNLGGAYPIQTIHMPGTQRGFLGGQQGLLRRSNLANAATPSWSAPAVFTHGQIVGIQFINENTGWAVANGVGAGFAGSFIFRTDDGGLTWREEYASNALRLEAVHGIGTDGTSAYAVGFNGALLKYEPFEQPATGVPSLPEQIDLGTVLPGDTREQILTLRNIGTAPFQLRRVALNNLANTEPFALLNVRLVSIAPGDSIGIRVRFRSNSPGQHRAELMVNTDAPDAVLTAVLSATVEAAPRVVLFDTEPSGLQLLIDDVIHTTPVAFTVTPGANSRQWAPGSIRDIVAPTAQTRDDVDFLFQAWEPAADHKFSLVAPESNARFVARYVPTFNESNLSLNLATASEEGRGEGILPTSNGTLRPSNFAPANTAPADVPTGPWLRLSNAQLSLPNLGALDVQGAIFLSAQRINASLQSGLFRIPQNTTQPGVLEVTAGSWLLDFEAGSHLRLRANGPGVKLLDTPTVPPSAFDFLFANNGHFTASFATLDDLPLLPGIVEFGPSAITLSRTTLTTLRVNGQARLLKQPGGQWTLLQPIEFQATEGPFTHTLHNLPDPLLNLGFMAIGSDTSSSIQIQRSTSGVFSVGMNSIRLDLFGRAFTALSGNANSAGLLTLTATPPASPFVIGPFRLETTQNSEVRWNVRDGNLLVNLAPSQLKAVGVNGWPANGVAFPEFQVNSSGDFNHRILLPTFTFDGIALGGGSGINDNHLRFRRQDGVTSVAIRHQQNFFGNENNVSLDVNSAGQVSGSFYGSFLGANISMNYNSAAAPYQFQTRSRIATIGYSLYFGSAGARYCQLACGINQPLADCAELFCFP